MNSIQAHFSELEYADINNLQAIKFAASDIYDYHQIKARVKDQTI